MFFRKIFSRFEHRLSNLERQQAVDRQSITDLESSVAAIRTDYDAKFAAISASASDTQARIDTAVAAAVAAKEAEDDAAFNRATSELKDIMASHVATVASNTPAPAAGDAGTGAGAGTDAPQGDTGTQGSGAGDAPQQGTDGAGAGAGAGAQAGDAPQS